MDKTDRDTVSSQYRDKAWFWLQVALCVSLLCLAFAAAALALIGRSILWVTPSLLVFAMTVRDLLNYWRQARADARNAARPPPATRRDDG